MIVIKIKTWKDWKKDFLDWVQEPRRKTCKDFVDYMEALQNRVLYKIIADTCDKYGNMREGQSKTSQKQSKNAWLSVLKKHAS